MQLEEVKPVVLADLSLNNKNVNTTNSSTFLDY